MNCTSAWIVADAGESPSSKALTVVAPEPPDGSTTSGRMQSVAGVPSPDADMAEIEREGEVLSEVPTTAGSEVSPGDVEVGVDNKTSDLVVLLVLKEGDP